MSTQTLRAAEQFDNYCSTLSQPLRTLVHEAVKVAPVTRIELPRKVWAVLLMHPVALERYDALRTDRPLRVPCSDCGAMPAESIQIEFRPPLDSKLFELLIGANRDGPILPGCMTLVEDSTSGATVRLIGNGLLEINEVLGC
jgi:hypothetical protein